MTEPFSDSQIIDIATRAAERNVQTQGLHESFASHRQHVMKLILKAADEWVDGSKERSGESSDRDLTNCGITLLGAGNCLDLNLTALFDRFRSVTLIDIDPNALQRGIENQQLSSAQVRCVAPVNLCAPLGLPGTLVFLDQGTANPDAWRQLLAEVASRWQTPPVEPASVVVSLCVLSQILEYAGSLLPAGDLRHVELLQAVRRGHMRRMLQLLNPGGIGLLITDLVSSETVAELKACEHSQLPSLLKSCLQSSNFFSGLHPGVLFSDLRSQQGVADVIDRSEILPPWLWDLGARTYIVYAAEVRRQKCDP